RAPTTRSAASYGTGLTGRTYINRLNGCFESAKRAGQLPDLGSIEAHLAAHGAPPAVACPNSKTHL
ncbi:MAG: hypothetical protein ACLQKK_20850, partial [Rhodomicrobium sp.]